MVLNSIIPLPATLPAVREETGLALREIDDPDLYVRFVNSHQGLKDRIDARRKADNIVSFPR